MLTGARPNADGGLYTATRYEFRSLPDIRRNLHQRPLKMEESPLHWLNGRAVPVPVPIPIPVPVPSDWWHWCVGIAPGALCCKGKPRQGGTLESPRVPPSHPAPPRR